MRYQSQSLEAAVHEILHDAERPVRGGIIGIDRNGNVTMQFNSTAMARAFATSNGTFEVHEAE